MSNEAAAADQLTKIECAANRLERTRAEIAKLRTTAAAFYRDRGVKLKVAEPSVSNLLKEVNRTVLLAVPERLIAGLK